MAGFINKLGDSTVFGSIGKGIKKLANLGMEYDDMVIKQSLAVGVTEAEFGNMGYMPDEFLYSLAMSDIGQKKFIAYFEKDYKSRREYLRRFAMNGEIDYIVETITDEAIVYDSKNYFANADISSVGEYLEESKAKEFTDAVNDKFKKIYTAFHFKESHDAWHYFKKFLIDGFLSFEIIYDKDGKDIIGFKELDPISLRPGVDKADEDGGLKKIWVQYEDIPTMRRELLDSQIIYISYAKGNFVGRLSYVERLVRSFNLLRIMENSRIIWNVMNSSFRLKMIVPIGTKSPQKAKESLAEMLSIYKEDIDLDFDSGELSVNGKPSMQFYKNYLFPSKNGESPEIETIGGEGPDLSDTETLKYFFDKLRQDSKIPFSRFDQEGGGGQASFDAGGMDRDEIRFGKFINRLRTIFSEILLKPLWLQLALDFPDIAEDQLVKANLGIKFNSDNLFEEMKMMEIYEKRASFVQTMQGITTPEADDSGMMNDVPYFNAKFLIQKYMNMTQSDIKTNEIMQTKKAEEDAEKAKEAGGDDGGVGF